MDLKESIQNLKFDDTDLVNLPSDVSEKINNLIDKYGFDNYNDIINSLPYPIKLIYLISEFESAIANEGLLLFFCNSTLKEINQMREVISIVNHKKQISIFDKAFAIISQVYNFQEENNFFDKNENLDPFSFFGDKLILKLEQLEEQHNELQDEGKYWDKIDKIYLKYKKEAF